MAESSTWKVSLFKASINTPNDIPRQNLQHHWSKLRSQVSQYSQQQRSSTSCFQFQELNKGGGVSKSSNTQGIVNQRSNTATRPHWVETVGGENGRNSSFPVCSLTFPQGVLTASLTTADGKTKTIKGCESREGGVKEEFLHDLVVPCGLSHKKINKIKPVFQHHYRF